MASQIVHNYCLVCSEEILPDNYVYLDRVESLFLLRILLGIPQDSSLMNQFQSLKYLPICKPCGITVKQCKEIYTEIVAQIQKFWGFQNEILGKIQTEIEPHPGHKSNQYWVELCRHFVKNRNVEAFKYPFVIHDLTKLSSYPLTDPFTVTTNNEVEYPIDTTDERLETPPFPDPLEFQTEYDNDDDKDNDISDQFESSEEDENPPQQFYWNRGTRQFHCAVPSCTTTSKIKMFVEKHFRREHSRTLPQKPKISYTCNWPSCGKIFKKKINHQSHIHKHRGTPSLKCGKCGQLFYYRRGLRFHQSRNNCQPIKEITGNYSKSIMDLENFVKNIVPNCDSIGQSLKPQPPTTAPINSIDAPCSSISENTEQFNYSEIKNFNPSIPLDDQMASPSWESLNVASLAIDLTDSFKTENDNIVIKEEPQFEDEDGDCISNESDENLELSEDDDCSDDDDDEMEEATSSPSNETSNYSDGYSCSWPGCGEQLRDKTSYACHMDRHRGTPKQKCEQCDQLFYSGSDLLNHQKQEHAKRKKIETETSSNNIFSNQIPSSSSSDYNFTPKADPVIVEIVREFEDEDNSDYYEMEEQSNEEFEDEDIRTNSNKSTPISSNKAKTLVREQNPRKSQEKKKRLVCTWPDCGKTMSCKSNMSSHMDQHKKTPQWKCDHCPHPCYWRSDLVKHARAKHGTNIPIYQKGSNIQKQEFHLDPITERYECPEQTCTKTYKNLRMMKDHYKEDHLKIKVKSGFVCEYDECSGRTFSNRAYWQAHLDKHKGTPQFKCEVCSQMFYWRHNLVSHQRKQNHGNQEKVQNDHHHQTYLEESLGDWAVQEDDQVDSIGTTPVQEKSSAVYEFRQDPLTGRYHCLDTLCLKSSVSKQYITQHYDMEHLKIKQKESFPCEWPGCGKTLGDKHNWTVHMDKHRGTPQFLCEKCDDKFYWRRDLIKHKLKGHEGKVFKSKKSQKLLDHRKMDEEGKKIYTPRGKGRYPKNTYNLKRDPISGKFQCQRKDCGKLYACMKAMKNHIDGHNSAETG